MTQTPQTLSSAGKKSFEKGDFSAAIQAFADAAAAYTEKNDLLGTAEAKNNLSVALLQAERPAEALKSVLGTDLVFAEAGDILRQAMAFGNQAAALDALGRSDEAITAYDTSAKLFGEINEGDLQAMVIKSAAAVKLRSGQITDTAFSMMESLNAIKKPSLFQRFLKFILRYLPTK